MHPSTRCSRALRATCTALGWGALPALCSSHPAQVQLHLERQDFPLSRGILLCVEWKSFFLLQNEYIKDIFECGALGFNFFFNKPRWNRAFLYNECLLPASFVLILKISAVALFQVKSYNF